LVQDFGVVYAGASGLGSWERLHGLWSLLFAVTWRGFHLALALARILLLELRDINRYQAGMDNDTGNAYIIPFEYDHRAQHVRMSKGGHFYSSYGLFYAKRDPLHQR
jgi:hypothetical protein